MDFPKLYSWRARRAGGRITITHSCGKIVGVDSIYVSDGAVFAIDKGGVTYALIVA